MKPNKSKETKSMRSDFYNLVIDNYNTVETLDIIDKYLETDKNHTVSFINAHCFNIAQKDKKYRNILKNTDLVLNDGIGIQLASSLAGSKVKENMNGTDFIPQVLSLAEKKGLHVFLLGSKPGVCEKAYENIKQSLPAIKITGYNDGYFNDDLQIVKKINDAKTDILIVGMGVPKQEIWIHDNKKALNTKICIAGGAIIDFQAGTIKRAPLWMRKIHLEWLYRLILEPKRLWKRYLIGNIRFFIYVINFLIKK